MIDIVLIWSAVVLAIYCAYKHVINWAANKAAEDEALDCAIAEAERKLKREYYK